MDLTLKLTLAEINVILQAMGQAPYASVFELVQKIKDQVQPQLASAPAANEEF